MAKKFPKNVADFIYEHHRMIRHKDLVEMINEKFGTSFSAEQIKSYYKNHKLHSGITGRFEKGCQSHNKGKKWDDFMTAEAQDKAKKTLFKAGHVPSNKCTVGSIRKTSDGYLKIKIAEPDKWMAYHKYIYQAEYGRIPPGKQITFADGNPENCTIGNIIIESKAQNVRKNQLHLHGYDKQSAEAANLVADIINKTKEISRKHAK